MPAVDLDRDQWQRLKPLLTSALRLSSEDRVRFFAHHLGSEPALQACALDMLRSYDDATASLSIGPSRTATAPPGGSEPLPPLHAGTRIGHYRIVRKLGEGGMGQVYLAEDERLGRRAALKRLFPSVTQGHHGASARAIAESRSIAVLNHPGIVVLYDVFEHDDELLLAMEYVEGRPLSELIAEGPLPTAFALRVTEQVADAVAYAHARGVLHCDLKPSNIHILPMGTTKILDFGLARIVTAHEAEDDSQALRLVGTPGYLSPEQLSFHQPTAASDVYAVGVVFYECLTGAAPFTRGDPRQALFDTLAVPPVLPSTHVPSLPAAVDEMVSRCLAKNPRDRLQAHELVRAIRTLAPLVDRATPSVDSGPVPPDDDRAARRNRVRRLLAVTAAVCLAALALWAATLGPLSSVRRWPWTSARPAENAGPVSLAILPTIGSFQRTEDTALGKAIPTLLRSALSRVGGLNVALLDDDASTADVAPHTAMKNLGATLAVRCRLNSRDGREVVDVELLSGDKAAQVFAAGVAFDTGNPARTFEEVFRAVERGLAAHAPRAQGTTGTGGAAALVPSTLALSHFTEALEMLERSDVAGNVERAITLLESAIQKDPSSAVAHAALARAQWMHSVDTRSEDSARRAQASVMTALTLDNSLISVKLTAATIQRGMGELDRAEKTLADVVAVAPASDEAHRLLGELLAARGHLERAQAEFDTAIALRPLSWRNHRAKGLAYYNAGEFEKAAASFTRVTELQPDSAWGYQMLGAARQQQGHYQEAIAAYDIALKLGPTPAAWSNIGKLHYDNGEYAKAVEAYKEALELRSGSAVTWRNLGDVLTVMGRSAEARKAYEQAEEVAMRTTRVNPADASALSTLAVIHAKLGRIGEGKTAAAKAAALAPRDRSVHYRHAVVLMLAGDRAGAQSAIDEAIRLGFSVTEARLDRDLRGLNLPNR